MSIVLYFMDQPTLCRLVSITTSAIRQRSFRQFAADLTDKLIRCYLFLCVIFICGRICVEYIQECMCVYGAMVYVIPSAELNMVTSI